MTTAIEPTNKVQTKPSDDAQPSTLMSQFARDVVSGPLNRVSEILTTAADTIDNLLGGESSPLPESAKGIVSSTSSKLRAMGDRASEDEAAKLIASLQKTASDHPAATAGIGATVGAALGLALAKLGGTEPKSSGTPTVAKTKTQES